MDSNSQTSNGLGTDKRCNTIAVAMGCLIGVTDRGVLHDAPQRPNPFLLPIRSRSAIEWAANTPHQAWTRPLHPPTGHCA
ncbi:MAG: hypothetical protein QM777_09455 [Pseudorhodoferax sp.]